MALRVKTKKRLALVVLGLALPTYIIVAINVVALFERPPILLELAIYIILGVIWALPLRPIFLGIGAKDRDTLANDQQE